MGSANPVLAAVALRVRHAARYGRELRGTKNRAGSFVVEAVIAVILLGTASVGLIQLARGSAELRHRADRELAALLTAENALERLQPFSTREVAGRIAAVEQACARASGCEVAITSSPFEKRGVTGIHLRVEVIAVAHVRVVLHDWRIDQPPPPPDEQTDREVSPRPDRSDEAAVTEEAT